MATRHATKATGYVLLIRRKWPTEHNTVDMVIFVIAVNFGEKWRLEENYKKNTKNAQEYSYNLISVQRFA